MIQKVREQQEQEGINSLVEVSSLTQQLSPQKETQWLVNQNKALQMSLTNTKQAQTNLVNRIQELEQENLDLRRELQRLQQQVVNLQEQLTQPEARIEQPPAYHY